jgi:hypothetical protein
MATQSDDLKAIRDLMEKSTKFISLSGLTGIMAGITAIAGAAFAYFFLLRDPAATDYNLRQETLILLADAMIVLILSIFYAVYFSWRKARKNGQKIFNRLAYKILYHLGLPLLTGGVFSLVLLFRGEVDLVVASTLVFYGLALINVSKYTPSEVHYLGIAQIMLGILALIFMSHGLIFWSLGFGICHMLYGFIMYFKYDREK